MSSGAPCTWGYTADQVQAPSLPLSRTAASFSSNVGDTVAIGSGLLPTCWTSDDALSPALAEPSSEPVSHAAVSNPASASTPASPRRAPHPADRGAVSPRRTVSTLFLIGVSQVAAARIRLGCAERPAASRQRGCSGPFDDLEDPVVHAFRGLLLPNRSAAGARTRPGTGPAQRVTVPWR
ncbi:hypothetical protein GCM10010517_25880 [Streptosporangium fragile]|uniref:Uncharacterized protein n=1 Tax=Streptosporangium fragile TaxID=46186 RepID=A0ABN3VWL9_9ACTN